MKDPSKGPELVSLEVTVELKGLTKEHDWPNIAAYAFARSGRLLARQPLMPDAPRQATARADLKFEAETEEITVKIGPKVGDIALLKKFDPVVDKILVGPAGPKTISFEILKPSWWCWIRVPYVVTGTVEKFEFGIGTSPVCVGQVLTAVTRN